MEAGSVGRRARRARVVCHRCHEKKIRCDLQRPGETCSACRTAATTCDFRPSYKGYRRKKDASESQPVQHVATSLRSPESSAPDPTSKLTYIPADESAYVRALLGHQSELHGNGNVTDQSTTVPSQAPDSFMPGVMRSYLEIYADICYPWCPVLDIDDSTTTTGSLLIDHSLAAVASLIRPSLMPGVCLPREHYERARHSFHNDRRCDTLTLVKAALLLSCCESGRLGSPTDSSFWWLGVAVRLAQSMRLHRVARNAASTRSEGLQKRIFWTLFARERMIALCQGTPCLIDESDCTLGLPTISDFPEHSSRQGEVFIHWVSLCRIMGEINKQMASARHHGTRASTQDIATSLITWLQALPSHLQLSIKEPETVPFIRDVHLLHLPYLTTIALIGLVNMNTAAQASSQVPVASIVAAGCTARLIGDILLRGCVNALPEDASWFITIAINALLHVRPATALAKHTAPDVHILRTALTHLGGIWSSAKVLATGISKLIDQRQRVDDVNRNPIEPNTTFTTAQTTNDVTVNGGISMADLFPFTSPGTSPLVAAILEDYPESCPQLWSGFDLDEYFNSMLDELFAGQPDLVQALGS